MLIYVSELCPCAGTVFTCEAYHIFIYNHYIKTVFIVVVEMTSIRGCILFSLLISVTGVQGRGMM